MTFRILRYVIVGIIAFCIGLAIFMPARIVMGWVDSTTPVTLGGVTGTLFSGHAAYAAGPGGAVENIDWTLHPASLLLGRLSADITIDSDIDGFSATAIRSLFGTNRIEDLEGTASAGWLAKLGGYTFLPLSGDVRVNVPEAQFSDTLQFSALSGQVQLNNARWQLFNPPVALGSAIAALDRDKDDLRVRIVDSSGPLAIDGEVSLDNNRRYDLNMRLRARAGADDRLGPMLEQLGKANPEGWHRVREQGHL